MHLLSMTETLSFAPQNVLERTLSMQQVKRMNFICQK